MTYYEVPSLPAIQQPASVGGTEGDVVYETISGPGHQWLHPAGDNVV